MSVKTSSRNAVLAYNAGAANSNDFVAVEVRNRITVVLETKTNSLSYNLLIDDNIWGKRYYMWL